MTDLTVRTLEASTKTISLDTVAGLRNKLRGTVALPGGCSIWHLISWRDDARSGAGYGCG
jgi:hypothetical protein